MALISGVSLKVGAAAVQAAYVGSVSVLTAPWAPAVRLTGSAFAADQIKPGIANAWDETTNGTRFYLAASTTGNLVGGSQWCALVKGTGATLKVNNSSPAGAVLVSVDGGAFTTASNSTTTYTLFTGLSDAEHWVVVKIASAYGLANAYLDRSGGNILNLTGTDTYVDLCSDWVRSGVSSAKSIYSAATVAGAVNYTPNKSKYGAGPSNIGSARIKGNFKSIIVSTNGNGGSAKVYVSKNGASPVAYPLPFTSPTGGYAMRVTGLSGNATYSVWSDVAGDVCAVAGDAVHDDVGTKKQIHQFGDSITDGQTVALRGEVDVLRVSASMGFVGLTCGIGGYTIAQLDTALDTWLPRLSVTSADVAIVAIGRNNTGGAFDAAETSGYQSIISKLVTKGYGKIICRGILPAGDRTTLWVSENGSISSIVSGVGNPNVVFCDVSGCPTYTTTSGDNTHPDAAGYGVVSTYVEPLYRTILGL